MSGTTRTMHVNVMPVDVRVRHSIVPCSTLIVKSTRAKYGYGGALCPAASNMHLQYVHVGLGVVGRVVDPRSLWTKGGIRPDFPVFGYSVFQYRGFRIGSIFCTSWNRVSKYLSTAGTG